MKKEEKLKKVKGYHTEDSRKDSEMIYPLYTIKTGTVVDGKKKIVVSSVMTLLRKKHGAKWHLHTFRMQVEEIFNNSLPLEKQYKIVESELLNRLHAQVYIALVLAKSIHLEGKGYGIETPYDKDQRSEEVRLRSTFPYLKK